MPTLNAAHNDHIAQKSASSRLRIAISAREAAAAAGYSVIEQNSPKTAPKYAHNNVLITTLAKANHNTAEPERVFAALLPLSLI